MTSPLRRLCLSLLAAAGGLLFFSHVHAQELTVRGRVIGPDDAALDAQRVVLHRVSAEAGATIAETTSDANGAFTLVAPASSDTTALLFVAVRYEGELYIGPAFRETDGAADQVIQVGVPGTSASSMIRGDGTGAATTPMAQPIGTAPPTSRGWLLWAIPLLGVTAVALYLIMPQGRIPAHRAALIRVAEIDERMQSAPDAQRTSLLQERDRLLARLRTQ